MVSDYGPAHDAKGAFHRAFKEAGGEIIGSVRFPVANPDFSAFVQRAKDLNPESIYICVPGGAQPAALGKALAERGIDAKKIRVLGQGEVTEADGDTEHGRRRARHHHRLALRLQPRLRAQPAFVRTSPRQQASTRTSSAIGGYDGMHLIYEALKKTGGKTDGGRARRRPPRAWRGRARGARSPSTRRHATSSRRSTSDASRRSAVSSGQRGVRQGRERQGPGEGPTRSHDGPPHPLIDARAAAVAMLASRRRHPVRRLRLRDAAVPPVGGALRDAGNDELRQPGALQLRDARGLRDGHAHEQAGLAVPRHASLRVPGGGGGERGARAHAVSPAVPRQRPRSGPAHDRARVHLGGGGGLHLRHRAAAGHDPVFPARLGERGWAWASAGTGCS